MRSEIANDLVQNHQALRAKRRNKEVGVVVSPCADGCAGGGGCVVVVEHCNI